MGKIKYKISTWKYSVEAEFDSEEDAIKGLSDRYMRASKSDQPGEHMVELLNGTNSRTLDSIAKRVYFYVYEPVYGNMQWVMKYTLNVYPFKASHWWPKAPKNIIEKEFTGDPFILEYEEIPFRYEIIEPEIADN